ncbi:glycoside hydrolase family 30 protein [Sphaerobolus stellatus SS14]|nr:glycoside hydrolase family 30 protein [Sphaerobolus stellatus SS14]
MDGFGASLTDSSAKLLSQLKVGTRKFNVKPNLGRFLNAPWANSLSNYQTLLNQLFNPENDFPGAGLTTLRVGLGATDFSDDIYSFDSQPGSASAPSYPWLTLDDIAQINQDIKIFLLPWSPPASMKSTNNMMGGDLNDADGENYAIYLLNGVQAFQSKGDTPYSIGILEFSYIYLLSKNGHIYVPKLSRMNHRTTILPIPQQ